MTLRQRGDGSGFLSIPSRRKDTNIQAAVQAAAPEPMESVVLLMLIGMQKEIEELKARVSEVETEECFALVAPNEDQN